MFVGGKLGKKFISGAKIMIRGTNPKLLYYLTSLVILLKGVERLLCLCKRYLNCLVVESPFDL